ncbi:MAG: hypothetical protein GY953_17710, partial [bacterium]|nr:hypothetical protein [bacterium]
VNAARLRYEREISRSRRANETLEASKRKLVEIAGEAFENNIPIAQARCKRIKAWAKIGRAVVGEPLDPDILAARAANAIKACDVKTARELTDDLVGQVSMEDPRAAKTVSALNAMLERERGISATIDGAKQHYNEGRALELEGEPKVALESYRVAMSQLRAARDATYCEERRKKVFEAISRVTERVAALQKPKEKEVAEAKSPIEQTEIEDANQACAEQFGTNAVMSTVDLRTSEYWCKCGKGYAWNADNTACVKAKSRAALAREACRKSYPNSVVAGSKGGNPMCNCPKGRQWNRSRTACIRAKRTQTARRQSQGLDPETAAAMRAIGGLIGQALRSSQYSRSRRYTSPSRVQPPTAGRAAPGRGTGTWKDRFGKQAPMTPKDRGLYGGGAGPR